MTGQQMGQDSLSSFFLSSISLGDLIISTKRWMLYFLIHPAAYGLLTATKIIYF